MAKYILFFLLGLFLLVPGTTNQAGKATSGYDSTPIAYGPTIFKVEGIAKVSRRRLDDRRPNIILILADDQPYHTVQYMPNHEVYTNRMPLGCAEKFDDSRSFAIWLQQVGYQTAYFGKYLNGYEDSIPIGYVPPGWDEWSTFLSNKVVENERNAQYYYNFSMSENGVAVKYPESQVNFSSDVITRQALSFIRDFRETPFFVLVAYYNPHSPYLWADRHDDQFRVRGEFQPEPYRSPNFMEEDVSDKPLYLPTLYHPSVNKINEIYRQILRSLLAVDDGVASILDTLENTGLSKKTIIIYASDNGLTVGNHRLGLAKNCVYEECLRVPFVAYAPGIFDARTDFHLVANIDLAPTFAELVGVSIPDYVDGASLLPLLNNEDATWRDQILIEHWPTEEGVGAKIPEFYAVRTLGWKYVEYSTGETERHRLAVTDAMRKGTIPVFS